MSPFELKNILIKMAEGENGNKIYNAGRGNPNFFNVLCRKAFAKLTYYACEVSNSYFDKDFIGYELITSDDLYVKLLNYIQDDKSQEALFLKCALEYAKDIIGLDINKFCFELVECILGDFYPGCPDSSPDKFSSGQDYPVPPRIYSTFEKVINAYLIEILMSGNAPEEHNFQLFATEGGTAAMIYTFKSLRVNGILKEKDQIAILTPIFSPYLEIPELAEYDLVQIQIESSEGDGDWEISEKELEKLNNDQIKAIFVVNPTNPTSVSLSHETVKEISKIAIAKDMIILTDTVYATFVDEYYSFIREAPENTICVYSFSKYFGVTGWRLGTIMISDKNIIDNKLLKNLDAETKEKLQKRYSIVADKDDVHELTFIDRLAIDSRDVALAHTGGLSGPQQAFMTLLSLYNLLDQEKKYNKIIEDILTKRLKYLFSSMGITEPYSSKPNHSKYYVVLNLADFAKKIYGKNYDEGFNDFLTAENTITKFLFPLAEDKHTVCLPAAGFAGPENSIRISLANLNTEYYLKIGKNIRDTLKTTYAEWMIEKLNIPQ